MANTRRSISVVLRAEVAAYKRDMEQAATATRSLAETAKGSGEEAAKAQDELARRSKRAGVETRQALNQVAAGFALAGTAMLAFAGLAVSRFAEFDAAMSSVEAASMETASNMEMLRQAALDAGASTVFSATESADAIENLAKAGVSTSDILNGGLHGALNLAASDNIAVADASEIAASAMTQFGLEGRDVTHIADLLAAGAGKAQGGVLDLGQALNQSGLVASQMGLSIEETTGSLAAFASAGLIGSDAGTSFRAMLLRLANPTRESADLMAELGINAYDAQGNFIGMEGLAGELADALSGLTQEQRNQALAQIFGQDAIRTSTILYEQGAEGIHQWVTAVDDQGYAAEQARIRLNNLRGDLEGLSGAFETALIGMGEGGDGPLRTLVQSLTGVVNQFNALPDAAQQAVLGIIGSGGFALLATAGVLKVVTAISDAKIALQTLGTTARTVGVLVGGVGAAIGLAAAGFTIWSQQQSLARAETEELRNSIDQTTGALTGLSRELIKARLVEPPEWFEEPFGISAAEGADRLGISLGTVTDAIMGNKDAWDELTAVIGEPEGAFPSDIAANAEAAGLSVGDYNAAVQALRREVLAQSQVVEDAQAQQAAMNEETDQGTIRQSWLAASVDDATGSIEDQTDALQDNIDKQREAAGVVLSERDAQRQWEQALDDAADALETNGANLDLNTQAGRDNQAALDDVAQSGWDLIGAMKANDATQDELQDTMQTTRDRFVKLAESMGYSAEDAEDLADKLGLIPEDVNAAVHLDTAGAELTLDQFLSRTRYLNVQARVFADPNYTPYRTERFAPVARAYGGPILGAGTETSDSILARLSHNEHVWSAAETRAAGGHGAMIAMRQAALAGKLATAAPGFAGGGPVLPSAASWLPRTFSAGASTEYRFNLEVDAAPGMAWEVARMTAEAIKTRLGDAMAAAGVTESGL